MQLDFDRLLTEKACSSPIDTTSNPNLMKGREADSFIDLLTDNSKLLSDITIVRTDLCKGEIPRLDVQGPVSSGACATSCPVENGIQDDYLTYDMVKYRSDFSIKQDFLECSKLGQDATDTITNMFMRQINNDREMAAIEGDETLPTGDFQDRFNNLLGVNDGFIALACACTPACQVIDAMGMGPSPALFHAMRKVLPARYRGMRDMYRYVVGPQIYDWWTLNRTMRPTDFGDEVMSSGNAGGLFGIDLYEVPLWPENLPFGSSGQTGSVIMYTPLDNLVHFVQREIQLEWERKPKCDAWEATMYWKTDNLIMNPDKMVLVVNVDPCGAPYVDCVSQCPNDSRDVINNSCCS